jgi:hypothetical protein
MDIIFPIIELVDRYTISKLKFDKTHNNSDELFFYEVQLKKLNIEKIEQELDDLYNIHASIWTLESMLKSGLEDQLSLEEIGRRAIEIRNLNNKRIKLKNTMAEKLGCCVREIKKDHLSQ